MANHKSSIKRARQTVVRTERNRAEKSRMKTLRKKALTAIASGDKAAAAEASSAFSSVVDNAANPTGYKVCEGCDSIVGSGVALCPNCHSYRFDASPDRVILQARILGSRE